MLKVVHPSMRAMLDELAPFYGKTLRLFQNNVNASRNSVLADFTEADFDGYAEQLPSWNPAIQNGVEDVALADVLTFTAGAGLAGPQTIYGYFVLDDNGDLAWAETFADGPTTISMVGQELLIFPQLKLKNYGE
jgi:hypothetical protein